MASPLVTFAIPGIAVILLFLFTLATYRSELSLGSESSLALRRAMVAFLGLGVWMGVLAAAALSGVLADFERRPPPMALAFGGTLILSSAYALSRFGQRLAEGLPVAALVGFQAFRLPLELVMHQAAGEGTMPSAMSFTGYNFDIVTGILATILGVWFAVGRPPRVAVVLFNVIGSALLLIITVVAVLALPLFAAFGPDQLNVWVTRFPFIWMAVMVGSALVGHIALARRLLAGTARAEKPLAPVGHERVS